MKHIWIFGKEPSLRPSYMLVGEDEAAVSYFSEAKMECDPYCLEGIPRPHFILNLCEQRPWTEEQQNVCSELHDAEITTLY